MKLQCCKGESHKKFRVVNKTSTLVEFFVLAIMLTLCCPIFITLPPIIFFEQEEGEHWNTGLNSLRKMYLEYSRETSNRR